MTIQTEPEKSAESGSAVGAVPVKRPRGRPRRVIAPGTSVPLRRTTVRRRKVEPEEVVATKSVASGVASKATTVSPMQYIFSVGRRKRAVARIFLYREGKGNLEINEKPFQTYIPTPHLQQLVVQPLTQSPFRQSVDVRIKVAGGGVVSQAEAIRHGIARALLKLDETLRPIFRARGYVTRDPREKERKKPGLKRARRAPQWQKR